MPRSVKTAQAVLTDRVPGRKFRPCAARPIYDILCTVSTNGEVAQLVEHHVRNVGVESSNLFFSTIRLKTKSGFRPFGARRDFFCPRGCRRADAATRFGNAIGPVARSTRAARGAWRAGGVLGHVPLKIFRNASLNSGV